MTERNSTRGSVTTLFAALAALAWFPAPATAQHADAPMTRAEEIALAEGAGPPALVVDATIYVLAESGYEVARRGSSDAALRRRARRTGS